MPTKRCRPQSGASCSTDTAEAWWESRWFAALPNMDGDYADYMSNEWGHPVHGEAALFEAITLEGAQAGLSWRTILTKREAYRSAFSNFEVDRVAGMDCTDIERLLAKPSGAEEPSDSVVRHRGKLHATLANSRVIQRLRTQGGLDKFMWSFVNHTPQFTTARAASEIPTTTPAAVSMSKELKALGFKFVGPTVCYSLMQSCGMVVDHPIATPEHNAIKQNTENARSAAVASTHGVKQSNTTTRMVPKRRRRR